MSEKEIGAVKRRVVIRAFALVALGAVLALLTEAFASGSVTWWVLTAGTAIALVSSLLYMTPVVLHDAVSLLPKKGDSRSDPE